MSDEGSNQKAGLPQLSVAQGRPEEDEAKKDSSSGVPKWLKTAGATTAILATAATIGGTIYALIGQNHQFVIEFERERSKQSDNDAALAKEKHAQAEEEKKKAEAQRDAGDLVKQDEEIKLKIAQLQLKQRDAELTAERDEKTLDAKRQQETAEKQRETNESREVSEYIGMLFDQGHTSEGILAQLSRYTQDARYRRPLLDALAAKLMQSKSGGEVRIIYALLTEMGRDSLQLAIRSNRDARRQLDDRWRELFWSDFSSNKTIFPDVTVNPRVATGRDARGAAEVVHGSVVRSALMGMVVDESGRLSIPVSYLVADLMEDSIYQNLAFFIRRETLLSEDLSAFRSEVQGAGRVSSDVGALENTIELQRLIVSESEVYLGDILPQLRDAAPYGADLSSCYLADISWGQPPYPNVVLNSAYIGEMNSPDSRREGEDTMTDVRTIFAQGGFTKNTVLSFEKWGAITYRDDPHLEDRLLNRFRNGSGYPL